MTQAFSNIAIIYNPNSTGDSRAEAKKLAALIRGYRVKLLATKHAGHAEELARRLAAEHKNPLIISSSGDGGYHEVVNGVMRAGNPQAVCAVLPAGNANDHARTMQSAPLPELIHRGRTKRIDLLLMQAGGAGRYAHSYIGLGLTPVIAAELNKHDLNAFKEIKIVLQRFYKYRPFKIKRGGRVVRLNSLLFANINQMAKILTLAQENKPADGKFEVILFPAAAKRRLVFNLFRAAVTGLRTTRRESTYHFTVLKKMPVQLDGEVMTIQKDTLVKVTCAHKALRTLI